MRALHGKLTATDIGLVDAKVLTAGQFIKIGSYTVKAGEMISLGYGQYDDMSRAVGRIYAILKTAAGAAEIIGEYMISIESPQDIPLLVLGNYRSEDFNTSATDKTKQIPFPEMNIGASKDKKIVFYFRADATLTESLASCVVNIDITRYLLD